MTHICPVDVLRIDNLISMRLSYLICIVKKGLGRRDGIYTHIARLRPTFLYSGQFLSIVEGSLLSHHCDVLIVLSNCRRVGPHSTQFYSS